MELNVEKKLLKHAYFPALVPFSTCVLRQVQLTKYVLPKSAQLGHYQCIFA